MAFFSRSGDVDPSGLRDLTLFRGITDDELAKIAQHATRREITAGETFIEQGRIGRESFAIAEGVANVYMNGEYVTSVAAGVIVGEMALVDKRPRNATLIAETDMVVAVFDSADLDKTFDESPELKERISMTVTRRATDNSAARDS